MSELNEPSADQIQSLAFLDSLIENLPMMVFVKEAKELRFIRFNKAGQDLLGFPCQEMIGKNDFDFFPKEQAESFVQKDREVLKGLEIVDIPEEPISTLHKGVRILRTKKIPLLDAEGVPRYLLGISEDITEEKKATAARLQRIQEEAIYNERESVAKKNAFLAEASIALASSLDYHESLERLGRLIVSSLCDWCTITICKDKEYERVISVHKDPAKQDLIKRLKDLPPLAEEQRGNGALSKVIKSGVPYVASPVVDENLVDEVSSPRHLKLLREIGIKAFLIVPIMSRNGTIGALLLTNTTSDKGFDLEAQKFAEELSRRIGIAIENALLYERAKTAIEIRDEFISIASHELKTPLTSMSLQLQLLRRNLKPELHADDPALDKLVKGLDRSIVQAKQLARLIEDLLDVSHIQAGTINFNIINLDLSKLVRDVVDRYSGPLAAAGCSVTVQIEDGVLIQGDQSRIEQILVNLISNAIKYAPKQPVKIILICRDSMAELMVCDSGPGISKSEQAIIFDRFGRGAAKNVVGLGLGLFISRQIAVGHGGEIRVESEPGQGACFIVQLPLSL